MSKKSSFILLVHNLKSPIENLWKRYSNKQQDNTRNVLLQNNSFFFFAFFLSDSFLSHVMQDLSDLFPRA
jgi:hypothetical protein